MTGLDKILMQIKSDSDAVAADTIAKAKAQADEIISEAKKNAQTECDIIAQRSATDVADSLSRAKSAAALQKRKAILEEKQKLIGEVITDAKKSLYTLPAEQYFSIIEKMAVKFALPQDGEILFSQSDLERLPSNFEAVLNAAINVKGAKLVIKNETRKIDGGFVLVYGGVEENCSFTALFDSAYESLQDKVHGLLF